MKAKATVITERQKAIRALRLKKVNGLDQREVDQLYGAYMALDWVLNNETWKPSDWLKRWMPR